MHQLQYLARVALSADTTPAELTLPDGVNDNDIIMLALVGGYNADLSVSEADSDKPLLPIWDDTGVTPVSNNTFWTGRARRAPRFFFASAATPIEVMVFLMGEP